MPELPAKQIVIKKEYFDNIKISIDSINSFFTSDFKNKNFPVIDSEFQLDGTIMDILSWLNNVDPKWIDDPSRVENALDAIHDSTENMDGDIYAQLVNDNNTLVLDHINAFVGYKVLQLIADHFTEFSEFINGIYTFELFTKPSKYRKVIDIFSQNIPLSEIEDIMGSATYTLFDDTKYVTNVFSNEQIKLPDTLKQDTEITRFSNYNDLNIDVVIDESVQEAAEVNYFTDTKPKHIKYDEKKDKWMISKQFEKTVNNLVAALRKCDTTDDLVQLFGDMKPNRVPEPDDFTNVVIPYILAQVYSKPSKYYNENYDKSLMDNYTNSYKSIVNKNSGAKRFQNYDLFSTFKTDKEGTIKFLEDFLKLNLMNDEDVVISNNTLLTLFNIFDSRIYLDIMYNMLPDNIKKDKYPDEDGFVKKIRARINKNSRTANTYKPDNKAAEGNDVPTTENVQEYVNSCLKEFGDMSLTDMQYCEQFHSLLDDEIRCIGDVMYNKGISQIAIDRYIGESYIQEMDMGDIPDYMKNRINISDDNGDTPNVTTTDIQLPPDVPTNPVDDLVSSIDAKLNAGGDLEDMLGAGYQDNPNKNHHEGKVVYNITNNYHNSFNRDSNNTTTTNNNDLSTGKSTVTNTTNTNSHNDSSTNKTVKTDNSSRKTRNNGYTSDKGSNNYNNSNDSVDTKEFSSTVRDGNKMFSSGHTIQEVFAFLESEEPLSDGGNAGKPPKGDLLTTAMDADRKTLSTQQAAKKKLQKTVNTGKALLKPVTRTKQWLTKIIDSLIKRDEDRVKAEIIENPSYRTALYKAMRLALKFGLTGICFTISGYIGAAYLVIQGAKVADKQRLRKEVQEEFTTELEILDDKIQRASVENTPESRKAMYQMMRLRSKMESIALNSPRSRVKHPSIV